MTAGLFVALAVAGGLGASARLFLDGIVRARLRSALPWSTIGINVTGSFALGILVGLAGRSAIGQEWVLILGTGLLGGYTTFSTSSFETVQLLREHRWMLGAVTGLGTLVAACIAAWAGIALVGQ